MKKWIFALSVLAGACSALAEGWTLNIGPAWRARVKSSISGSGTVQGVAPSQDVSYDKDIAGHGSWSVGEVEKVQDPDYSTDPAYELYAATRTATTTTVTPNGNDVTLAGSEDERPMGLRAIIGYDFYQTQRFSFGLGLKFASYWNMRSVASGSSGGGTISVHTTKDYYLFSSGPIPDELDFTSFYPDDSPYLPYQENADLPDTIIAGRMVNARIRSDLYQVGLGPQATWHICDWLDAYGRGEVLCNIAHMNFDVGRTGTTDDQCLLGFGGTIGLSSFFAENLGLYAEVGYEWIDKASKRLGTAKAEVDFSSLVVSAGVIVRF